MRPAFVNLSVACAAVAKLFAIIRDLAVAGNLVRGGEKEATTFSRRAVWPDRAPVRSLSQPSGAGAQFSIVRKAVAST